MHFFVASVLFFLGSRGYGLTAGTKQSGRKTNRAGNKQEELTKEKLNILLPTFRNILTAHLFDLMAEK